MQAASACACTWCYDDLPHASPILPVLCGTAAGVFRRSVASHAERKLTWDRNEKGSLPTALLRKRWKQPSAHMKYIQTHGI